ncbi:MAG TPA: polyprenyl diphosphate synthase [Candidatus Dormibacteraeota bacterium]|nr:polyprenyl diphosphate synthase [Candidatus Dormibacteraeota bacterium]
MSDNISKPNHLGLILDGNRRWAREHGMTSFQGHKKGYDNLKIIAKYAFDLGVNYVSAYIFSLENWDRSKREVTYLMNLAYRMLTKDINELNKNKIRIVWLGSKQKISKKLLDAIHDAEEKTKNNKKGTLCICFNYGGYQEIIDAFHKIIDKKISKEQIDVGVIEDNLYGKNIPKVDLMIRTSGEQRISNFMLWRMSYAELLFSEKHWPAFTKKDLAEALVEYSRRERRFGK